MTATTSTRASTLDGSFVSVTSDMSELQEKYDPPPQMQPDDAFRDALDSYLKYLQYTSRPFGTARWLGSHLTGYRHDVMRVTPQELMDPYLPDRTIATIIDISNDSTVRKTIGVSLREIADPDKRGAAFESFRNHLKRSAANTHTRIVSLAFTSNTPDGEGGALTKHTRGFLSSTLWILFSSLIVGAELDLEPSALCRLFALHFGPSEQGTWMKFPLSIFSQHYIAFPISKSSATWLGRRKTGEGNPFTGTKNS